MKNRALILIFPLLYPFTAYLQNGKGELLATLKSYEQYKSIYLTYTYRSLDANCDTFSLFTKEEITFTRFKSNFYFRISSLKADIFFSNKFIFNKRFLINTTSKRTKVHDLENANIHEYNDMPDQLKYTRFGVRPLILPLLLNDSSELYNNRFWQKILSSVNLKTEDSLLLNLRLDENYHGKNYRFDIQFPKFNRGKAYEKWDKYFPRSFIDSLPYQKFIIIYNKEDKSPVEYSIYRRDVGFEEYKITSMGKLKENFSVYFTPDMFLAYPKTELISRLEKGRFSTATTYMPRIPVYYFIENDYLNNRTIEIGTIKSEYILLYIWDSQHIDTTASFKDLCKIVKENPAKLTIIGVNSYNESKEYIERIHQKNKWNFPTIKGRDICKYYHISECPVYILFFFEDGKLVADNYYMLSDAKLMLWKITNNIK